MKRLFLLCLFLVSFICIEARRVEVVSVYCKKEVINGKVFIHREDIVNSEKKGSWSIDGAAVTVDAYEEAILDAEKEERRAERRALEMQRERAQQFKHEALITLNKKILRLTVEKLDVAFEKFNRHDLVNFLDFRSHTIPSSEFFYELKDRVIPEAKKMLTVSNEESDWGQLNLMVTKLDAMPISIESLFYDTVRNAIKQCDDTRLLKELLEIVSRA